MKIARWPVEKKNKGRMIICLALMLLLVPYIGWKLYYLCVIKADEYGAAAAAQQTRDVLLDSERGDVTDRNGILIAGSAACETIALDPYAIEEGKEAALASDLASLLGLDYDTVYGKTMKKNSRYQLLVRQAESEVCEAVRALLEEKGYEGVNFYEDSKRYYPYDSLFSTVVGFTDSDGNGSYGIELSCDDVLTGVSGRLVTAKDLTGHALSMYFEQRTEARDGYTVRLTLDATIQQIVTDNIQQALEENECNSVSCVVMDVNTGAILAMAQTTSYDENNPRTVTNEQVLATLSELSGDAYDEAYLEALYEQWSNNAIQTPYEPGSVFKIITAAIALEEGTDTLNSTFYCGGSSVIDTTTIACWKSAGHGTQTFSKALQNSCNCAFMSIAKKIGFKSFYTYFEAFGFTEKTGIDMMGEAASVAGVHYHVYDTFSDLSAGGNVTLATYSFGQTFKVTPIQLITAVSAVVNGGCLMQPYVVDALLDEDGNVVSQTEPTVVRQVISKQTSETMCELLEAVVATGTGNNAYVAGYHVGGKTGTSEKRDKSILEGEDYYIASFMGVAPCNNPQVAVLLQIDEPTGDEYQGGQIAGPVVGRIMKEILPVLGVSADYTEEELQTMSVKVDLTVGGDVSWAKYVMEQAGFEVKIVGTGTDVTAQRPVSGSYIPAGSTVVLYCGEEPSTTPVTVPDLTDMTYEEALNALSSAGLYMDASGALGTTGGELKVRNQLPVAGEGTVPVGSVVTVEFYSNENVGE